MDEKGYNYEVKNLRGEYDIEYSYRYGNDPTGKDSFRPKHFFEEMLISMKYNYLIETWSFKGFMKEYILAITTNLKNGTYWCCSGYIDEVTDNIVDSTVIFKDNKLYINEDKFIDKSSSVILKSIHNKIIKVISYNNKTKPYIGTGTISISSESDNLYQGYFKDNLFIPIDRIEELKKRDIILETNNYRDMNILISHEVDKGRCVMIAQNLDTDEGIQYIISNESIMKVKSKDISTIEDDSYIQYIDGILYVFLDNNYIKDKIEIVDGFGDKIVIEKLTRLYLV